MDSVMLLMAAFAGMDIYYLDEPESLSCGRGETCVLVTDDSEKPGARFTKYLTIYREIILSLS